MPTIENVEVQYLTGLQILHDEALRRDPILVLSTDSADFHFLVTRDALERLAAVLQNHAKKMAAASAA